jgi:hypothetical protein
MDFTEGEERWEWVVEEERVEDLRRREEEDLEPGVFTEEGALGERKVGTGGDCCCCAWAWYSTSLAVKSEAVGVLEDEGGLVGIAAGGREGNLVMVLSSSSTTALLPRSTDSGDLNREGSSNVQSLGKERLDEGEPKEVILIAVEEEDDGDG